MFPRARYQENKPWEDIESPLGMPKYNGANFFMVVGKDGAVRYFSRRKGVKGNFPERTAQLPHLTNKKLPDQAGHVFNVELIHTGHAFTGTGDNASVSGILNSLPEKAIETQNKTGPVRAVLLNVIHPVIPTFKEKLEHMKGVEESFGKPELISAPYVKIGAEGIRELIDSSKRLNQEGVIITSLTKPESENTRIKLKNFNTWNLKVKSINQEFDINGNPKQSAGSLVVVDSSGKESANVGTGLSKELRKEIWEHPENWIGKEIQVKGMLPVRHRIIAPVYSGNSDGELDLVKSASSSSLEDRLLENLVNHYQSKGANFQKILDNPLFQQLPLDKKVAFIEQAGGPLLNKPTFSAKSIGTGVLGGGIAGAISLAMHNVIANPGGSVGLPSFLIATGGGALLGGVAGTLRALYDKSHDTSTMNNVAKGGLPTLIGRTGISSPSSPLLGKNRYLGQIEGFIDNMLGPAAYTIGRMEN